jgi:hypothetical protein
MFSDQLRTALLISWLVISTLLVPLLLAPFLLPPQVILALAPERGRRTGEDHECAACDMAASFVLISEGRLNAAIRRNEAAIPLYSALVWNECVAIWYALEEIRRTWKDSRRSRKRVQTEKFSCRS